MERRAFGHCLRCPCPSAVAGRWSVDGRKWTGLRKQKKRYQLECSQNMICSGRLGCFSSSCDCLRLISIVCIVYDCEALYKYILNVCLTPFLGFVLLYSRNRVDKLALCLISCWCPWLFSTVFVEQSFGWTMLLVSFWRHSLRGNNNLTKLRSLMGEHFHHSTLKRWWERYEPNLIQVA